MKDVYVLASDIGGSGTKTILFNLAINKIVHTATKATKLYHPEPDSVTQDPGEMLSSTIEGMKECIQASGIYSADIAAIVMDGQQAGLIWIDEDYNAISPFDSWLDNRFVPFVQVMDRSCGERILAKGGNKRIITTGPKMLWWKANKPAIYDRACKLVIPATYVGGKLAGLKGAQAYFENTSTGYTGMIDYETDTWDEEICKVCGITIEKLPEVVEPTRIVGKLCAEYARELGIPTGIPVVSGAGDFPAGGIGAGVLEPGQAGDISGTASLFFACSSTWNPDPAGLVRTLRSPIEGFWYAFCFTNGGGCIRWFADNFVPQSDLRALTTQANSIPPGSEGLAFYPYIGGTTLDPSLGGAYLGIKWNHSQAHAYRAILESIAFEYKSYATAIHDLLDLPDFSEIRVFGGGSENLMWNQMKADILDTTYARMRIHDCSLLGSVIIAGKAIGFYKGMIEAARTINSVENISLPEPKSREAYDSVYERWRRYKEENYSALKGI